MSLTASPTLDNGLFLDGSSSLLDRPFPRVSSSFYIPEQVYRANLRFQEGIALRNRNQKREAVECFAEAVVLAPSNAEYLLALGQLEFELDHLDEAALCFEKLTRLEPRNASAWLTLGFIRFRLGQFQDAIMPLSEAVYLDPASADATFYLAESFRITQRYEESIPLYQRLLPVGSQRPHGVYGYALSLLALGRLEEGWEAFEFRMVSKIGTWQQHNLLNWDGTPNPAKTVLAYSEEGIAADIMYASCLPDLSQSVGRCVVECDESLHSLFARSFPEITFSPLSTQPLIGSKGFDDPLFETKYDPKQRHPLSEAGIDEQVALGSLPRFFRKNMEKFPKTDAFLVVDPAISAKWAKTLDRKSDYTKVGILWQGTFTGESEAQRTIPVDLFRPILSNKQVNWISLQHGSRQEDVRKIRSDWRLQIDEYPEAFKYGNMEELAGLLSNLDLVISPPGYVANLAAALGVETWLIVPYPADWRWTLQDDTTPWFPRMRLLKQHRNESLQEVFSKIFTLIGAP
ncbi:MAG: tetratricopeptide repeat-containing glycosyltransferase family protein [Planctomycetaceae bacterium]|nr:tetratricopeptide repeat-containing glycosyltransferase family protein [Planctomycetaceae bacterium]